MPIYMDVHMVPGVKARAVAQAHQQDLLIQQDYGCKCMTYWVDEERETVFCLIEAPDKDAVKEMHRKAHGLIPNKVIEVSNNIVQSFLGRIYDPEGAEESEDGLKVISEASFRVLLLTFTIDPVVIEHRLGKAATTLLFSKHQQLIRNYIIAFSGSEVENVGSGFILSFSSASKAVSCALGILNATDQTDAAYLGLKMSIQGGEPIEKSSKLFGDTLQKAHHLGNIARHGSVVIADKVRQLVSKENKGIDKNVILLSPQDEGLVEAIFSCLEANWNHTDFDVEAYGQFMAMSKSQLYRKCIALTGVSPNLLLRDFRLEKAKELLKKQQYSISQVTFESGFSSASYFTKCFKKKYGLLPIRYVEMMHT